MTIQQVKEQGLSAAQQDLIELAEEFEGMNLPINRSELTPQQKATVIILEKRGYLTIAKNGDIKITEKSKEDKTMATKKVEKAEIDEKVLKAVARDLNDVLGLEPEIDLKAKDLLERVREEAAQVGVDPKTGEVDPKLVAGDKKELQPETWEFLEVQGMLDHLKAEVTEEEEEKSEPPVKEEEEVKPVAKKAGKKAPVEKAGKPVKEKVGKKGNPDVAERKEFIKELITKGKFTKAQITEKVLAKFPSVSASTINTFLTDQKNPKYAAFGMVATTDEKGVFSF